MKITEYPPQKRTIIVQENVKSTRPYTIHLPKIILIDDGKLLFLLYEHDRELYSFDSMLPNVYGSIICFGKAKPSMDNFWNTYFDPLNEESQPLLKPNWWEHKITSHACYDILYASTNYKLIKNFISEKELTTYELKSCATNAIQKNKINLLKLTFKYAKFEYGFNRYDIRAMVESFSQNTKQKIIKYIIDYTNTIDDPKKYLHSYIAEKAIEIDNIYIIELIIDKLINVQSCLNTAIKKNRIEIRNYLLNHLLKSKTKIRKYILNNGLICAAKNNDYTFTKQMLQLGADKLEEVRTKSKRIKNLIEKYKNV